MKKIGLICLALVLALGMLGVGYAAWTDTVYINQTVQTGEVSLQFLQPISALDVTGMNDYNSDIDLLTSWQVDKDVGGPTELVLVDSNILDTTLVNVYPWYFERIEFHVHNDGTIPVKIQKLVVKVGGEVVYEFTSGVPVFTLDLDADGYADVKIRYLDNLGLQLEPCQVAEFSYWIVVLQEAPQNSELSFTLELVGIQWNLY